VKDKNMERRSSENERSERSPNKKMRKVTEYGRQLQEKQRVKKMYGLRERQFRRFYDIASHSKSATGEALLSLLERRLDNILYRLKLASTRRQARQIIVHGHIMVNGKKVSSPSYIVNVNDVITLIPQVLSKSEFLEHVIDKRLNTGIKVPEWLELDKKSRKGQVLRDPVRTDIQTPIEDYLIVELYSKY
jgi:small subunit ribosomal protein S4